MVWGIGDFKTDRGDVGYVKCQDEKHLLQEFLVFWKKISQMLLQVGIQSFLIFLICIIVFVKYSMKMR